MGGLRAARSSTMMVLSTILIKASLSATERTPRWPLWDKPVFRGWSRTAAVVGWRKPSAHIWHLAPGVRTLGPSYASWQHWTKVLRRALEPGSAHALVRATRVLAVRMRLFVHRPCLAASTASFLAGPDPEMSEKFSRWTRFAATDEELAVWRHPPLASLTGTTDHRHPLNSLSPLGNHAIYQRTHTHINQHTCTNTRVHTRCDASRKKTDHAPK